MTSVVLHIEYEDLMLIVTALRFTQRATASPQWAAQYGELCDKLDAATGVPSLPPSSITHQD
jgi:hypothetical protein